MFFMSQLEVDPNQLQTDSTIFHCLGNKKICNWFAIASCECGGICGIVSYRTSAYDLSVFDVCCEFLNFFPKKYWSYKIFMLAAVWEIFIYIWKFRKTLQSIEMESLWPKYMILQGFFPSSI